MITKELRSQILDVGRESWLLFVALTLTNASNYVFHVAVSRVLGPKDYGALGAILAFLLVISVPLSAIQTTTARRVAAASSKAREEVDAIWKSIFRAMLPVGGVLALALLVSGPFLMGFFRVDSFYPMLFLAAYAFPAVLLSVLRGALQGTWKFQHLALVSAIPVCVRLVVGISAVRAGAGVTGAVAATFVAELVTMLVAARMVGVTRAALRRVHEGVKPLLRQIGPTAAGLAAMWLVIELDLMLSRYFLLETEAGNYAAAGMLARAVLFVPGAISLIALPHFAKRRGRGQEAYRWLLASCALVASLGLLATGGLVFGGDIIVSLTFGGDFSQAAELLPVLAMAMVGLSVANLVLFFHIAAGTRVFHLLWLVAVLEAVTISLFHNSGHAIAFTVLLFGWAVAGFGLLSARGVALAAPPLSKLPPDLFVHTGTGDRISVIPELSLIVPAYNGGPKLVTNVTSMVHALERLERHFEVIIVSDGSTDGSAHLLASCAGDVSIVHYPIRQGKGMALRVGLARAKAPYVAFIDSDGDLDPLEFHGFLAIMDLYKPDLVLGSKRHPLSEVRYPPTRRTLSWLYQRIVRCLFGLDVRDTQTGMKLIRRDVLDAVLPRILEKRFAFDLEFLVVARQLGYRRLFEAPIRLEHQFSSTISPKAAARILLDTVAIFYRRYLLRYYATPPAPVQVVPTLQVRESPLLATLQVSATE